MQLAIKTGWSLEYIEALPFEVIAEFKALNAWHPFTEDRQAHQLGVIASMLSAKVYKKPMKPDEIFPYLQSGVPDFLEDERVAKARKILKSMGDAPEHIRESQLAEFSVKLKEEIDIEMKQEYPDMYVISQLEKIANG